MKRGLTPLQETFATGLAAGLSQAAAYREAYPKSRAWRDATVWRKASLLAAHGEVRARVAELLAKAAAANEVTVERVQARLRDIAFADARELTELRRGCCRYCWGEGFRYQRTAGEMERARREFDLLSPKQRIAVADLDGEFDTQGGVGYHAMRDPNPECPECFGNGIERPRFNDTRRLSPAAAALFAGVKTTKDGIEVKVHDQQAAVVQLGQQLGMFAKNVRLAGPDGGPVETVTRIELVAVKPQA